MIADLNHVPVRDISFKTHGEYPILAESLIRLPGQEVSGAVSPKLHRGRNQLYLCYISDHIGY